MRPFLSIITICFNEQSEIRKTCASIASQSFADYEWIVIDGGSTDGTLDILKDYLNKITVFVSEPDHGIYHAMNKGIQHASGEYVLFLNGGDYLYDADVLQRVLPTIKAGSERPDILYGEMMNAETGQYLSHLKNKTIDLSYFARIANLHHQATFIKREIFQTLGEHDESYKIAGDYEWWVRYFARTTQPHIHYLDHKVAYFNMSGISTDPLQRKKTLREIYRAYTHNTGEKASLIYPHIVIEFIKAYIRQILRVVGLEAAMFRLYQRLRKHS